MKARFIQEIGTRGHLRIYWSRVQRVQCSCEPPCGRLSTKHVDTQDACKGFHNAMVRIDDRLGVMRRAYSAEELFGKPADYPPDRWPTACNDCGMAIPEQVPMVLGAEGWHVVHQVFADRLYDCPSGKPEAGDIYFIHVHDPGACSYWDNCDGNHLYARVPNGEHWDIDSRAANCTLKEDRTHRCWVRTGKPDDGTIDVGKGGHTCSAGAGSIQTATWHGFLRNGTWIL